MLTLLAKIIVGLLLVLIGYAIGFKVCDHFDREMIHIVRQEVEALEEKIKLSDRVKESCITRNIEQREQIEGLMKYIGELTESQPTKEWCDKWEARNEASRKELKNEQC